MRRHSEYTRRLCSPYRASNDSESPPLALSIASASEMPEARIFFACVNSPYSDRYLFDAISVAVVVLTLPAGISRSQGKIAARLTGNLSSAEMSTCNHQAQFRITTQQRLLAAALVA